VDVLDRLLDHDAWTTRQLLLCCRELPDAALDQEFDIGHRTLRRTMAHVVRNMEVWTDLIAGRPVRPDAGATPAGCSAAGLLARLDAVAPALGLVARALARAGRLDDRWVDPLDDPPTEKSYGGAIAHVVTHGMHHRAQALHMLRRLGVRDVPEGDVLSWEAQAVRPPGAG
jgi:uncharacterized damage-inducible protein DinB